MSSADQLQIRVQLGPPLLAWEREVLAGRGKADEEGETREGKEK